MSKIIEKVSLNGEALVREYLKTPNQMLKEKIVKVYSPLVKYIVGRINLAPSAVLNKNDLYQYGVIGLLKALERFRPEVGAAFKAFAYKRVYGEIIDSLRKGGLVSRRKYEKVKMLEKALNQLKGALGREPGVTEICKEMNISEKEYQSILGASQMTYMLSLDEKITDGSGDTVSRIDTIEDREQKTPEEYLSEKSLKNRLKALIGALPERQRIILALYYTEELTLVDIGKILGISESRVSQILNQTLLELKTRLA